MTYRDVRSFLQSNLSAAYFMSLSEHRKTSTEIISKYETQFVPSVNKSDRRNFCVPAILAVQLKKNKVAKHSIEQLASKYQQRLSNKTKLAPVQAKCEVPDHQADDVRFWVAASSEPVPVLSNMCFTTKQSLSSFAEALRMVLKKY